MYQSSGIANGAAIVDSFDVASSLGSIPENAARHPRAVAVLLCERIIRDARTDRLSLIDIVKEVSASPFPLQQVRLSVYARLTGAGGLYAFAVDVVRRDDLLVVATIDIGIVEALDPLDDGEIFIHQVRIPVPTAGSYDARLWANRRFVQSVSFEALG